MSETQHHHVFIVGSGPAGYTAGLYAARANLSPFMVTGSQPGGQLTTTTEVENYPGFVHGIQGPEMMTVFEQQAVRFGLQVHYDTVEKVDFSERPFRLWLGDGTAHTADAVIICTGATAKYLGIPGEEKYMGHGVSACATCDGFFFKGQELAIVGGGDTAMEEATYLTKFASTVYLVHRRDSLRASKIMQERFLSRPNAKVLWNKAVSDVLGTDRIEGIEMTDTVTGAKSRLDVKGLFIAIGHTPATRFLAGAGIELTESGYVALKNRNSYTNIPGVFAAGDVSDAEYRQAVTAAGMGCQAALDAERWLAATGVH